MMSHSTLVHKPQFWAALLDSIQDGIFVRSLGGEIIEVNRGFCEMTGFSRDELVGEGPPNCFWPPDQRAANQRALSSYMSGVRGQFDLTFCKKSGDRFSVVISASPFLDPEGQLAGAVVTVRDVTQRKQTESAILAHAAELAALAHQLKKKNEELDQFAYITSHDLKAPLRGIANLSRWIEEDMGERFTPEARQQMELLRGRVHRMEALIEGILQISRVGRVKANPERVDVAAMLREVVDLLHPPPEFNVEIGAGMPVLHTDKLRLEQVFMNLLGNAIKHHGGPKGHARVSARDAGSMYEFSVSDDGPGIAPAYHEKVFVIFQTLAPRDKVEGTGIGLALVKKIVEDQGGRIHLDSAEGTGATFRFTWPKGVA